ncbi:MAG: hybrid sensor histidine kinase/response regulator [Candidatus Sericytochromatia bacterium]
MVFSPASVLIIDDNQTTSHLIASALDPQRYHVRLAGSGKEGLACLTQQAFDLVLLDMMMPHMSGLEVCRQIKAREEWLSLPVIFITGHQDDELLAEAFAVGAADYLTKPFLLPELAARVDNHLRLSRTERQLKNQLALRDLMLTTLSHDLRGPVGTAARILTKVRAPQMAESLKQEMLSLTETSLYRTYELLEDLLSWAQAVTGKLPFRPYFYPLLALVEACCEPYLLQAEAKKLVWQIDVPAVSAWFDKNLLRSILLNLIGNAVKFSEPGGTIGIRVTGLPTQLQLTVSDTGLGMSDEVLSSLKMQRPVVSQLGTAGEKGSGMGLKLCQEFAHCHGSQLQMSSEVGKGSVFQLVLNQPETPEKTVLAAAEA